MSSRRKKHNLDARERFGLMKHVEALGEALASGKLSRPEALATATEALGWEVTASHLKTAAEGAGVSLNFRRAYPGRERGRRVLEAVCDYLDHMGRDLGRPLPQVVRDYLVERRKARGEGQGPPPYTVEG